MAHRSLPVMDPRCPLGLRVHPKMPCQLAISALHKERSGKLLVDGSGKAIPACDWYVADRSSNYCFFSYMRDNEGQGLETIEIAALLHSTQTSVYDALKSATEKVKDAGLGDIILGDEG